MNMNLKQDKCFQEINSDKKDYKAAISNTLSNEHNKIK